jgi:paraquat-inducible protein A
MKEPPKSLVACPECDLLLREIDLEPGRTAVCRRCGAALYRNTTDSIYRTLALGLAAALLFIIANIYPILGIESQGNGSATNLYGAVGSLWDQKMHFISLLVFITTIVVPSLELSLLIYLLLPLRLGHVPPGLAPLMRFLQSIKPWGMVEVFMLGILVALVKLTDNFRIIPGVALWSFGGVTLLLAAVAATFNPRDVWAHLDWNSNKDEQP